MTKKELEKYMRDMPINDYDELLRVFGFNDEDTELMNMRYRDSMGHKATREEIAEEAGISTSTLDRYLKNICTRIIKYPYACVNKHSDSIPSTTFTHNNY